MSKNWDFGMKKNQKQRAWSYRAYENTIEYSFKYMYCTVITEHIFYRNKERGIKADKQILVI